MSSRVRTISSPRGAPESSSRVDRPAPPCILVIFGASGDLTARLLVPSLLHLRRSRLLPEKFAVLGVARTPLDDESFRQSLGDKSDTGGEDWSWLAPHCHYLAGAPDDPATY